MDCSAPGTSSDKFAFASNYFSMLEAGACPGDQFAGTDVLALDWSDWLGPDSDFSRAGGRTGTDEFTPRVAVQVPATSPTLRIIIEKANATAVDVAYTRSRDPSRPIPPSRAPEST